MDSLLVQRRTTSSVLQLSCHSWVKCLQASTTWIRVVKWKDVPSQQWAMHTPSQRVKTDRRFSRDLAWDDEIPFTKSAMKREKVEPSSRCSWKQEVASNLRSHYSTWWIPSSVQAFPLSCDAQFPGCHEVVLRGSWQGRGGVLTGRLLCLPFVGAVWKVQLWARGGKQTLPPCMSCPAVKAHPLLHNNLEILMILSQLHKFWWMSGHNKPSMAVISSWILFLRINSIWILAPMNIPVHHFATSVPVPLFLSSAINYF